MTTISVSYCLFHIKLQNIKIKLQTTCSDQHWPHLGVCCALIHEFNFLGYALILVPMSHGYV
jgi:hypothetical protein